MDFVPGPRVTLFSNPAGDKRNIRGVSGYGLLKGGKGTQGKQGANAGLKRS